MQNSTMIIDIFDVELGQCAMIYCPNGQKIMIDAGHNASQNWYPSSHFRGQKIDRLVITNFDEDHVSDLVNVIHSCTVDSIIWSADINSKVLYQLKAKGGMGNGVQYLYNFLKNAEESTHINYDNTVQVKYFSNQYGFFEGCFNDTNNLSLVTFVTCYGFTILFPGDLEVAGWQALLKNPAFCNALSTVNVLVASHHGRENGYCEDVFKYCSPNLIIISDRGKIHSTQETTDLYADKALGCITSVDDRRKVITTRKDGNIRIEVNPVQQGWRIFLEKDDPNWKFKEALRWLQE